MPDLFQLQTQTAVKTADPLQEDFLNLYLKAKQLLPQIEWVITHRKIDFLENLLKLQKHSSIQIRRKIAAGIGLLGDKIILEDLKHWQIHESDRQTWLILEASIDKLDRKLDSKQVLDVKILTVSEAISQIKNIISEKVYTIEGELSEVKMARQMYYFAIKDKEDTRLDCGAFVGKIVKAGFPLNEGLAVRVSGKFKLSKFSKIYFDVEKIQLTGQGELLRNLLELEKKLKNEGLFDPARKRTLKKIPKKILLLASLNSAALTDFTKVLKQRIGGVEIYLLPIKTQGVGAELEILEKLKIANKICEQKKIDTVVLTRGGGSKDDLFVFNSEAVVRQIHILKVPSLVAIGHERDTTLAELVADVRASTPSQAAELVSISRNELKLQVSNYQHFFNSYFSKRKNQYKTTTNQLYQLAFTKIKNQIQSNKDICRNIDNLAFGLINKIKNQNETSFIAILNHFKNQLQTFKYSVGNTANLQINLQNQIQTKKIQNQTLIEQIYFNVENKISNKKHVLELSMAKIEAFDVKKVLEKGFAIIWQENEVITTKQKLDLNKSLEIQFQDGKISF